MSKLIIPGSGEHLIDPAFDKFLDSQPTRRELQATFQKIGQKITELFQAVDTQALVANFLCERAFVTREQIEEYVAKKAKEIEELQKNLDALKTAEAEKNAQSNS